MAIACLASILNIPKEYFDSSDTTCQIHLPARYGGIGLSSALGSRSSAYWASWADVLPSLHERVPDFSACFMPAMIRLAIDAHAFHQHSALRNLHEAAQQIQSEGFHDIPAWIALVQGSQPVEADADNAKPNEGRKGWQREASKHRNRTQHLHLLSSLGSTGQARLRSSAVPNAARWL